MTPRPHILPPHQVRAALDKRLSAVMVPLPDQLPYYWVPDQDSIGTWFWRDLRAEQANEQIKLPFEPGDRLWVRETFRGARGYDNVRPRNFGNKPIWYEADGLPVGEEWGFLSYIRRPSTQMPRWASRLTLIVTAVDVLRVQDVTGEQAEQCAPEWLSPPISNECFEDFDDQMQASWRYSLWRDFDDRHGQGSYERNLWCALATVDVHKCNVDAMKEAAE